MRLEMTRTFPVPRKQGWDYAEDFHTWPEWLDVAVVDPESSSWEQPGDTVQVTSRMLGLRFQGSLTLEERVVPEKSRTLWHWRGSPDFHIEQHYEEAGPGAFTIRVVAYVDDAASRQGKIAAWVMTNVPFMMRRQLKATFDRLDWRFGGARAEHHAVE